MSENEKASRGETADAEDGLARREALERMGKLAVYTAPTLTVLSRTPVAVAQETEEEEGGGVGVSPVGGGGEEEGQ